MTRDNRTAVVLLIAWGALLALIGLVWLGAAVIAFGLVGLTPWGRRNL